MRRLWILATALSFVTISAAAAGSAPSGGAWQTLMNVKSDGVFPLGWAAGRVWFVERSPQDVSTVWSARVGKGRLTSLVATPEGQNDWIASSIVVGSSLVAPYSQPGGTDSSTAPLLANGHVGAWTSLPGDPENTTRDALAPAGQQTGKWLATAGATIGGRTVWALAGLSCPASGPHRCGVNGGGFAHLAVCCTADGQPVDLTSIQMSPMPGFATDVAMGVDTQGRLWLAWVGATNTRETDAALKLVQLDPATLKPLALRTLGRVPLFDRVSSRWFVLACSSTCRLVYQARSGASSWDGRSVTQLWKTDLRKGTGEALLGAAARGSELALASSANKVPGVPDDGLRLTVSRSTTGGVRAVSSIDYRLGMPHGATHVYALMGTPSMIATPSGFVGLAFYLSDDTAPSRVLAAVLRG